jgi:hypothetical protein
MLSNLVLPFYELYHCHGERSRTICFEWRAGDADMFHPALRGSQRGEAKIAAQPHIPNLPKCSTKTPEGRRGPIDSSPIQISQNNIQPCSKKQEPGKSFPGSYFWLVSGWLPRQSLSDYYRISVIVPALDLVVPSK